VARLQDVPQSARPLLLAAHTGVADVDGAGSALRAKALHYDAVKLLLSLDARRCQPRTHGLDVAHVHAQAEVVEACACSYTGACKGGCSCVLH
jgi:hypothetical protein